MFSCFPSLPQELQDTIWNYATITSSIKATPRIQRVPLLPRRPWLKLQDQMAEGPHFPKHIQTRNEVHLYRLSCMPAEPAMVPWNCGWRARNPRNTRGLLRVILFDGSVLQGPDYNINTANCVRLWIIECLSVILENYTICEWSISSIFRVIKH